MFLLFIFVVIALVGAIFVKLWNYYMYEEEMPNQSCAFMGIYYSLGISFFVSIILLFAMSENYEVVNTGVDETTIYEIHSLQDNSDISGRYFLGIGGVGNTLTYYVMVKEKDGVIFKEINPKKTIVIEEENCVKPRYVKRRTYEIKKKKDNTLSMLLSDLWFDDTKETFESSIYVLYIPKGSIKQGYEVDLK